MSMLIQFIKYLDYPIKGEPGPAKYKIIEKTREKVLVYYYNNCPLKRESDMIIVTGDIFL